MARYSCHLDAGSAWSAEKEAANGGAGCAGRQRSRTRGRGGDRLRFERAVVVGERVGGFRAVGGDRRTLLTVAVLPEPAAVAGLNLPDTHGARVPHGYADFCRTQRHR